MTTSLKKKRKTKKQKEKEALDQFKYLLSQTPDPRRAQGVRYPLESIITIALMAMIAGADNAQEMEDWGEANENWLKKILPLPHGIPSQDVFLHVFAALNPDALLETFLAWMKVIQIRVKAHRNRHIAIDGKSLRRSFDKSSGTPPLHKVSAWASDIGMVIGQNSTSKKSNEITAIPELLKIIDIRGCTITIDSMGCQTAIAQEIKDRGGDYLLAVKGNQGHLHTEILEKFAYMLSEQEELPKEYEKIEKVEEGHGRIESRTYHVLRDVSCLSNSERWAGISFLVLVESNRMDFSTNHHTESLRYYIGSDKSLKIGRISEMIRKHWEIENSLHWVLDTAFREDESRHRAGNCAENFSTLRHFVLNLIKNYPKRKHGVLNLRKQAGWKNSIMIDLLLSWKI